MITLRCTDCMTVILFYRDDRIPKTWTCPACENWHDEQHAEAMARLEEIHRADLSRPIRRMADF